MAINQSNQTMEQFNPKWKNPAAVVSIILGLAGAGVPAWNLTAGGGAAEAMAIKLLATGFFGLVIIAGVQMMRGCLWSQRLLLAFFLATGMLGVLLGIAAVLWGQPQWWDNAVKVSMTAVLPILICCSILAMAMLVAASASRLRYGAIVAVSVATAVLLVIVVNMIAHKDPYRKDVESSGRYGLSPRTIRILESVNEPVQLTAMYTSSDPKRLGSEYRDAVIELLGEIQHELQRQGKSASVVNVVTDGDRMKVQSRLAQESSSRAPAHVKLLNDFVQAGDALLQQFQKQQQVWSAVQDESYLGLWGINADVPLRLTHDSEAMEKIKAEVTRQLSASVPDFAKLTDNVKEILKGSKDDLDEICTVLQKLGTISQEVKLRRDEAVKAVAQAHQALSSLEGAIGKKTDTMPADASPMLKQAAAAAKTAGFLMERAAGLLSGIGGKDNAALLAQSRAWSFEFTDPRSRVPVRTSLASLYSFNGKALAGMAAELEDVNTNLKAEGQAQYIQDLRAEFASLKGQLNQQRQRVQDGIDRLMNVDDASKAVLEEAAQKKLFEQELQTLAGLLEEASKLPQIKPSTLGSELASENVVLIETAGRIEAVGFDDVWPLKSNASFSADTQQDKRIFNGDSAVSSRLLAMTQHKSFGTVYLVYAGEPVPPAMAAGRDTLAPWTKLSARLKDANFEVKTWNLAEDFPDAAEDPATKPAESASTRPSLNQAPRIMLVLPFAPDVYRMQRGMGSQMRVEHIAKLKAQIDAGASAMVLSQFSGKDPALVEDYLRGDWGLDVRTDCFVMSAVTDETVPGKFRVDLNRLQWLPLNMFSDHPIGRPLRSQRVLFSNMCPIYKYDGLDQPIRPVTYQPLLGVPESWKSTWAVTSENLQAAGLKLQFTGSDSFIAPAPGDKAAPMDIAVAVTSAGNAALKPSRLVVLAMGFCFSDYYVTRRAAQRDGQFSDPPRANVDLVANAAYWLAGQENYIAAGPIQVKPIDDIPPSQMNLLWSLCVVGLPAMALVIGAVVALIRRA